MTLAETTVVEIESIAIDLVLGTVAAEDAACTYPMKASLATVGTMGALLAEETLSPLRPLLHHLLLPPTKDN